MYHQREPEHVEPRQGGKHLLRQQRFAKRVNHEGERRAENRNAKNDRIGDSLKRTPFEDLTQLWLTDFFKLFQEWRLPSKEFYDSYA